MSLARDLAWKNLNIAHQTTIAHQFAGYCLELKYDMFPSEVVTMAKRVVLDALACGIGAFEAPGRSMIEKAIMQIGGPDEATTFCSGVRTSVTNATLINSFLVRYLDANDMGGGGHNNESIPALLSTAQRQKSSGREFLTAVVLSYELGYRVWDSIIGPNFEARGWNIDCRAGLSMPGPLGMLMGLSEEQIANAIGIAGAHAPSLGILDCHREEMAMAKNLRFGFVAQHCILACMLAQQGFTGFVRIVEGDKGFSQILVNNEMDLEKMVDFSGWRILKTNFKSICMNWTTNAHILATLHLVKEHNLFPADIASVTIKTSPRDAAHVTTFSRKYARNTESATHSAFFGNAIVIKERALGPEQLRPDKFTDPVVLELIEKINVEADHSFPERGPGGASEIYTKDGRKLIKRFDVPHGHIDDPMSDEEIKNKFKLLAGPFMDKSRIETIVDTVWNIEKLENVGDLADLLVC